MIALDGVSGKGSQGILGGLVGASVVRPFGKNIEGASKVSKDSDNSISQGV